MNTKNLTTEEIEQAANKAVDEYYEEQMEQYNQAKTEEIKISLSKNYVINTINDVSKLVHDRLIKTARLMVGSKFMGNIGEDYGTMLTFNKIPIKKVELNSETNEMIVYVDREVVIDFLRVGI